MSRTIAVVLVALVLSSFSTAFAQDDARTYQERRRALTREWASASSPAQKRSILERFRQLQLEERRAGVTPPSRTSDAEALIDEFTSWGNLDENGLGAELARRLPGESDLVREVFRQLGSSDRDDVALPTLQNLTDQDLDLLASDPTNRGLLRELAGHLNGGNVSDAEESQIERAVSRTSRTHGHLVSNTVPPAVTTALENAGATLQPINEGGGTYVFDEYSVVVDRMPPGVSARDYLMEFARNPNATVNDGGFNAMNVFTRRRTTGDPAVGDIYDIDILGPDDGDVVLSQASWSDDASRFVFSTITTPDSGTHPEYGNREFGYFKNADGSYTFYTRGASRPANAAVRAGGKLPQAVSWTRLMRGISDSIDARGGSARPNSFNVHTDPFR